MEGLVNTVWWDRAFDIERPGICAVLHITSRIDANSSLLLALDVGRQEEGATSGKRARLWAESPLTSLQGWWDKNVGPLATHVGNPLEKMFCTFLGLLTFLSENDISTLPTGLTRSFPIFDILNMWLFDLLEPSSYCLMGQSHTGTVLSLPGGMLPLPFLSLPLHWAFQTVRCGFPVMLRLKLFSPVLSAKFISACEQCLHRETVPLL